MDHSQAYVNDISRYNPREDEREKASNGYLMSVVAVIAGLPLPIINLLASMIFFFANRRATYFVRWHCTQALVSQFTIFIMNSIAFTWTIRIVTGYSVFTDAYIGYIATILIFNIFEFIINIRTAIRVRKGIHASWVFWGPLTDKLVKQRPV